LLAVLEKNVWFIVNCFLVKMPRGISANIKPRQLTYVILIIAPFFIAMSRFALN
jgi:hypothetical protein